MLRYLCTIYYYCIFNIAHCLDILFMWNHLISSSTFSTLRLTLYLCIPPICWLSFRTAIFITFHDTCLLRYLFHRTVPETYNNEFTLTFYYKFSLSVLLWMEQGANELSLFKFRTRVSVHVNAHEDCNLISNFQPVFVQFSFFIFLSNVWIICLCSHLRAVCAGFSFHHHSLLTLRVRG